MEGYLRETLHSGRSFNQIVTTKMIIDDAPARVSYFRVAWPIELGLMGGVVGVLTSVQDIVMEAREHEPYVVLAHPD